MRQDQKEAGIKMTKRLYWEHPDDKTFVAKLIRAEPIDDQPVTNKQTVRLKVWLDQTLFYPEGGGQPWDTGFLKIGENAASFPVIKVIEEKNEIVHYVECPLDKKELFLARTGKEINGQLNWKRRFDHMQQHTGQHILTSAFITVTGAETTGFHLGEDYVSIDLNTSKITWDLAKQVERAANEIVFENLTLTIKQYNAAEAPLVVRQRLAKKTDVVRVVQIGDYDICACAGTHVKCTAEVGPIIIGQLERAHGGVRVIFRCGWRALTDYQQKQETIKECADILQVAQNDVSQSLQTLVERVNTQRKEIKQLQGILLEQETVCLIQEALKGSGLFVKKCDKKEPDQLRRLAKTISSESGRSAVIFTVDPKFSAAISSGTDQFDARLAARILADAFGAQGGGNKASAQIGSKETLKLCDEAISQIIHKLCSQALPAR